MKAEIVKDVVNPLLRRREIDFSLSFEGAQPSRLETKGVLGAAFDLNPELLIIERMETIFGKQEVTGYAKVYDDADSLRMAEREHILRRNSEREEELREE
ncbi:MAG: 30S ribosomal protein S24e [Candidatus Syntropharchaeales archaeon]|nr:30S ribosomal protein S24e [Candidatus Syntrophoarchaeum sp.]